MHMRASVGAPPAWRGPRCRASQQRGSALSSTGGEGAFPSAPFPLAAGSTTDSQEPSEWRKRSPSWRAELPTWILLRCFVNPSPVTLRAEARAHCGRCRHHYLRNLDRPDGPELRRRALGHSDESVDCLQNNRSRSQQAERRAHAVRARLGDSSDAPPVCWLSSFEQNTVSDWSHR
jgi:hypothetical protein